MNKYRVHTCFVFILTFFVCTVQTGSRKRYRNKKKQTTETVHTHIDINSFKNSNDPIVNTDPVDKNITPAPAIQKIVEYDNPLLSTDVVLIKEEKKPVEKYPIFNDEEDDENSIELNFENADLQNFIKQIEDIFEVTFMSDDDLQPLPQGRKSIKGNKISFKTNYPLSKKETWNLFLSFLDIAGFTAIVQADPKFFRITTIETARKSPLPTFIGVDYTTLPNTDEIIRYVYFLENASTETIKGIIEPLRSSSSQGFVELKEHKGFILTDKAYNIKMLMKIIKELDKVSIPESMTILKLRNADAKQVQDLYTSLLPKEEATSRFFTKKQPTSLYFPENTRIIAEPRTNTLILLGPTDAIKKIENFIVKYIDIELDQAYSPLYTYQLKYADAATIADIMNNVTAFGKETEAGKHGGVRGADQYMRPMAFIPEKETNRLIIKGYYEDYLKAKNIIDKLDEAQPQVAIEVLIVSVDINNNKSLGAQLRSKEPGPNGLLGNNIKFQTSGLYNTSGIVTQTDTAGQPLGSGVNKLLGNLLNLVTGASVGTTLLTLGRDTLGVWGIFQALHTITDAEIISNPFLLATNNTKATVALGEERRVVTSQVVGGSTTTVNGIGADDALLKVTITPQINSDGMIVLKLDITIDDFIVPNDPTSAQKTTRNITTNAIVANKEVLALGGLIRNNITTQEMKVPILGNIPILGWFFKNKTKKEEKTNLLILISSRIIEPKGDKEVEEFTNERIADYRNTIDEMTSPADRRDPIQRLFFQDKLERAQGTVEKFVSVQSPSKKEVASPTQPVDTPPEDDNVEMSANAMLINTIHRKKRTPLSLSKFLQHKEVRS
jgi:general secretion pathway protein D